MYKTTGITLETVKAAYSGPERQLWELIMGAQVHIGGLKSSQELAEAARISPGSRGVDLCCCTGGGVSYLLRCRNVAHMTGVDATPAVIGLARKRAESEGLSDRAAFVLADACRTGLDAADADFVWGEDAWCYVADKEALLREAARLVKPGGAIAFTDWVAGEVAMDHDESERLLQFMKFPSIFTRDNYVELLRTAGLTVDRASDTGRFARYVGLYLDTIDRQLGYDVLRIMDFNQQAIEFMAAEMTFMQSLANDGKLAQGMFIAHKE